MAIGEAIPIAGRAVANHLGMYACTPRSCVLQFLQNDDASALAYDEAIARFQERLEVAPGSAQSERQVCTRPAASGSVAPLEMQAQGVVHAWHTACAVTGSP